MTTEPTPTHDPIKFFDGHPSEHRISNWRNRGLDYDGLIVRQQPPQPGQVVVPIVPPAVVVPLTVDTTPAGAERTTTETLSAWAFPMGAHVDIVSEGQHVGVGRLNDDGTIELIGLAAEPKASAKK